MPSLISINFLNHSYYNLIYKFRKHNTDILRKFNHKPNLKKQFTIRLNQRSLYYHNASRISIIHITTSFTNRANTIPTFLENSITKQTSRSNLQSDSTNNHYTTTMPQKSRSILSTTHTTTSFTNIKIAITFFNKAITKQPRLLGQTIYNQS